MTPEIPASITPLTSATSDMDVINEEKQPLLFETEEAKTLLSLVQDYDRQEEFARHSLLKKCKKGLNYWNNLQYIAWDEVAHDYRTADQILEEDPQADIDPALYAKVVNIYKAHGEILIGALTAGLPVVRFPPKDADDPEDVGTSKAYSKIAELIQKHNRAKLLLMKSLFILYNQGLVACYNENKADYRFGTIKEPIYSDTPVTDRQSYCPSCGEQLGQERLPADGPPVGAPMGGAPMGDMGSPDEEALEIPPGVEEGEEELAGDPQAPVGNFGFSDFLPDSDEPVGPEEIVEPPVGPPSEAQALPGAMPAMGPGTAPPTGQPGQPGMQTCPNCKRQVQPEIEDTPNTEQQQTGESVKPKNRECLEIYGPMNVKMPLWVRDQFSTPYLILETEEHIGLVREIYPELADRIHGSAFPDSYEREARVPSNYRNDFPRDIVTVQRCWLRPWALNNYIRPEDVGPIKDKYPKGIYIVIIDKELVAEIVEDKLDDHWTIAENPLSEVLHAEPIGAPMIHLQDIENEVTNLTLETIEFGIPETFADTRVLDFDAYPNQEARPGQISPATSPSGSSLGEGFFTVKASTLSREVSAFQENNTQKAQFVMGSYPSVYGGASQGSGGTAREYELSRTSALQRLSSTWTIVQEWWSKVIGKSVLSFAKNMQEDEKMVQSKGSSFVNVWIRKIDLGGQAGELEPEVSEAFPVSWSQKRDVLLNLIQMKDEDIATVIRHPENAGLIASIIGVPELYIPGDDDRSKQLTEIAELIVGEPQMGGMDPMTGQPMMISTVQVTPDLDNNPVESEICGAWLKSEVGQDAKKNNPGGYMNVLSHKREHDKAIEEEAMKEAMKMAAAGGGEGGPPGEEINSDGIQIGA